jgi:hypothetical protein
MKEKKKPAVGGTCCDMEFVITEGWKFRVIELDREYAS